MTPEYLFSNASLCACEANAQAATFMRTNAVTASTATPTSTTDTPKSAFLLIMPMSALTPRNAAHPNKVPLAIYVLLNL